MGSKTATVIGSSGLIGSHLLAILQDDTDYETIRLLVRRPSQINHSKVEIKLVDFADPESFKLAIDGSDVVFCAIGTTQKKVKGNKEAYRKVDYDIPVNAAHFCAETHCKNFLLVSSAGANSNSSNFYLKLKGEVEDAVERTGLQSISLFRPSMLLGKRKEFRFAEKIAQPLMQFFAFIFIGKWEKYRPIEAVKVARAMVRAAKAQKQGTTVYEYDSIRRLSKKL